MIKPTTPRIINFCCKFIFSRNDIFPPSIINCLKPITPFLYGGFKQNNKALDSWLQEFLFHRQFQPIQRISRIIFSVYQNPDLLIVPPQKLPPLRKLKPVTDISLQIQSVQRCAAQSTKTLPKNHHHRQLQLFLVWTQPTQVWMSFSG